MSGRSKIRSTSGTFAPEEGGKWNLATAPELYLHSSAAFYELKTPHPFVRVTHYKE